MISFPLDIYPEVALLGHLVVLFLIFWGPPHHIIFILAELVYIPTNKGTNFLN